MEEKVLVLDCLNSLNNIIKYEDDSILVVLNLELRNFFKSVRASDENLQEEIRNLGTSKGYIEKLEEIDIKKVDEFKQNIVE